LWGIFFIGKQKVVLFHKYRENGWESAASALRALVAVTLYWFHSLYLRKIS
jgi:hypothetical protein